MRHRGRNYLIGAASAAGVLVLAIAPAAGVAKSKKTTSNLVKCKATLTLQIPPSQDQALPGQTPGKELGPISCAKGVGGGFEQFAYKIPVSGDQTGTFVAIFKNGTIRGKVDLVPQEGSLGNLNASTFGAASYAGTVKHLAGTGAFASASGTGSATCNSTDGLHFKCVEKL